MANSKQLKILKQGVETWNRWMEKNRYVEIDLSGANLEYANLDSANLGGANLGGANLQYAILSGAYLSLANLSGATLTGANLLGADLINTNFSAAFLRAANLTAAHLQGADFSGANLTIATLNVVFLSERNPELKLSSTKTNFSSAKLGDTVFGEVDLREATGLDKVEHVRPSAIGIDTISKSKGKIPEVFLRGCGLSDIEIEFAKLAAPGLDPEQVTDITYKIHQLYLGGGIQYYSCFISYSSKDQEFAQQLHDDLQNNGVRCWFDREDIKIGDPIRPTIDRQIRLKDKLLVILSENSIKSEYVGDEVEAALEEEQKSKRLLLFPIRLDDTALNTRDDWAAKIKRRRHIGDFTSWKDKVSYQKAFERLLRDLKASNGTS